MTEPVISLRMSGNERGSDRADALQHEIIRHPERWDFDFEDIDLDLLFRLEDREVRWELKTPQDWLGSCQSGHLAAQRMQAASYDHPAQIAVLGSDMDVLACIPKVTKQSGFLNPRERAGIECAIERWEAACFASGFPVHYFHGSLINSMRRICRWSRDYLIGNTELPRPKAESWQEYALCGLPGVGPTIASGMLNEGIAPDIFIPFAEYDDDKLDGDEAKIKALMRVPKVGRVKAAKILEAVR